MPRKGWKRAVWLGLQVAVLLLTVAAAVSIARLGWATWQTRAGVLGGETLILPLMGLLLYCGWAAKAAWGKATRRRRPRKEAREHVFELQNVTALIGKH